MLYRNVVELRRYSMVGRIHVRAGTTDGPMQAHAVLATQNRCEQYLDRELVDEVLLAAGAQLPTQTPMLLNHDRWRITSVVGSVRDIRRADDDIVGRLVFSDDPEGRAAWGKVSAGHVTDLSVGYTVGLAVRIAPGEARKVARRLYRAGSRPLVLGVEWQLKEVSLVTIGADSAAKVDTESIPAGT